MRFPFALAILILIILFSGCADSEKEKYLIERDSRNVSLALEACPKINDSDMRNRCFGIVTLDGKYCEDILDKSERDNCYSYIGVITGDSRFCDKMSSDSKDYLDIFSSITYKDSCYALIANMTQDIDLCKRATSHTNELLCYTFLAVSLKDSSLCKKINEKEFRDNCYLGFAKKTEDETICNQISNITQKESCILVLNPPSYSIKECEEESYYRDKERCYFEDAVKSKNPEFCNGINYDEAYKLQCMALASKNFSYCPSDECLLEFALTTSDGSICSNISDWKKKLHCMAFTSRNSSLCDLYRYKWMVDENTPWNYAFPIEDYCAKAGVNNELCFCRGEGRNTLDCEYEFWHSSNECYKEVALYEKEPIICEMTYNSSERLFCVEYVAESLVNPNPCFKLSVPEFKDECISQVAISQNNSELCNLISTVEAKDDCLKRLSIKTGNYTCEEIDDSYDRSFCFINRMVSTGDILYCSYIKHSSHRDNCYMIFVESLTDVEFST